MDDSRVFSELQQDYPGLRYKVVPFLLAGRSKTWVCDRSLAEIASSNPAGGMEVCLL